MNACPAMIVCAVRSVRSPRIGLSRCLSWLWSASTRLLAWRSTWCHADGTSSSRTAGFTGAASVNDAAVDSEISLVHDVFNSPLTSAILTAALEACWYGLATGVPARLVLLANLQFPTLIRPFWIVLGTGLLVSLAAALVAYLRGSRMAVAR